MEWTERATQELNGTLDRLRAALAGREVDIDEVAADIKARIEDELAAGNGGVVTAGNVRAAAMKIGVQDLFSEPPDDAESRQFMQGLEKPGRIRRRIAAGWFWFTGIILPLLALGTELAAHLCLESGISDPLPTPFHAVLIALVPLSNLLSWLAVSKGKTIPLRRLGLLSGMATGVAAYYTLLFITVTPFAIMGFAAIIYFGVGLICFLPLSPLLSLIATLRMRVHIRRSLLPAGQTRLPLFRRGLCAGLAAVVLASAPLYLTKLGLSMAASDQPETRLAGIRLLRSAGNDVVINRACYWGAGGPVDPISWLITRNAPISPDQARDVYYRVTGTAFNSMASPTLGIRNRRNPGGEFDWDPETGGDVVAGRLKGLALNDSRIDGTVSADAATAYLEWTMVFRNDWSSEREARAQIALPPGAAVSRLTLWVDGEEREAAFGGRSQVKQAYKKVVQRRRDPVLVTTCGPDRVLMQCYPVPAGGEMKIRVGITAPLATPSETGRSLRLPQLIERNFRIPEKVRHAVWIKGGGDCSSPLAALHSTAGGGMMGDLTDADLNTPSAALTMSSSVTRCRAQDGEQAVLQEIRPVELPQPDHVVLVIDSSACMQEYLAAIAGAAGDLPEGLSLSVLIADDEPLEVCRLRAVDRRLREELAARLRKVRAAGGKDNGAALRAALTIPGSGKSTRVVWIHGPQEWGVGAADPVRQALERQDGIELLDLQVGHGPHRLVEQLEGLAGYRAVPRTATAEQDIRTLFSSFAAGSPIWTAVRAAADRADTAVPEADSHLVRLYALDRIRADLADNRPGHAEALELSLKHHLVTPVSGAVVLETQQQYAEADLKPVDSDNVPNVPEPAVLILMLVAALLLFLGRRLADWIRSVLPNACRPD